jgi:hypothetical protein
MAATPTLPSRVHALAKHIGTKFLLDGGGAHGIVRLIVGKFGFGQNIAANIANFDSVPLPKALLPLMRRIIQA